MEEKSLILLKWGNKEFNIASRHIDPKINTYFVDEPELSSEEHQIFLKLKGALKDKLTREDVTKDFRRAFSSILKHMRKTAKAKGIGDLTDYDEARIGYLLYRDLIGFDIIHSLMADPEIRFISCDGLGSPVYVYHENPKYRFLKTNLKFKSQQQLGSLIWRMLHLCKEKDSDKLKGILPDGSFLTTDNYFRFSIRKKMDAFGPEYLIQSNKISTNALAYILALINNKKSIMIVGPKLSGKSSFIKNITTLIPKEFRVVSIENEPNIVPRSINWSARVSTVEQKGKKLKLLKQELHKKTDYLIVDEIGEDDAGFLIYLLNSQPAILSFTAGSPDSAIYKLSGHGFNIPKSALTKIDAIVSLNLKRQVEEIMEVLAYDRGTNEIDAQVVFQRNSKTGKLEQKSSRFVQSVR
jgi:flagellar protein FlaI